MEEWKFGSVDVAFLPPSILANLRPYTPPYFHT
jgi:hypothetical protein